MSSIVFFDKLVAKRTMQTETELKIGFTNGIIKLMEAYP